MFYSYVNIALSSMLYIFIFILLSLFIRTLLPSIYCSYSIKYVCNFYDFIFSYYLFVVDFVRFLLLDNIFDFSMLLDVL